MRRVLGLTGPELGKLLGVRFETISRWERGEVPVDRGAWLLLGGLVLERAGRPLDLRRAATFLSGRGSGTETVADVPPFVVDAFYKIRFGHVELTPDELAHVDARLDALEQSLRPVAS